MASFSSSPARGPSTTVATTTAPAVVAAPTICALHPDLQIPLAILNHPPSRRDGVPADVERAYRIFGCDLIAEMALRLRAPQVVAATAQTLLHRFYYRRSLLAFDVHIVALAALFLAGKVEEQPRRMRDILNVLYATKLRRQGKPRHALVLGGMLYAAWKAELIRTERIMLKELGFSMYNIMEHPHKFLLYYMKVLGLDGGSPVVHTAWALLNDSLRLDLCVRYHAQSIACAAIYTASRMERVALPKAVPWYAVFSTGKAEMEDISEEILALYDDEAGGIGGLQTAAPLRPHGWLPSLRSGSTATADDDTGEPAAIVHSAPAPASSNTFRTLVPAATVTSSSTSDAADAPASVLSVGVGGGASVAPAASAVEAAAAALSDTGDESSFTVAPAASATLTASES